jgi:hypothetical protein
VFLIYLDAKRDLERITSELEMTLVRYLVTIGTKPQYGIVYLMVLSLFLLGVQFIASI